MSQRHDTQSSRQEHSAESKTAFKWVLVVVTSWCVIAAAVIAWGRIPHRVAYDQLLYHSQTISRFAAELPHPDFTDYLSATTPGFHLMMAVLEKYVGLGVRSQQIVCALITCVWLGMLAWMLVRSGRDKNQRTIIFSNISKTVCLAPLALSMYVFAGGVYVLPDNTAWLGVSAMLMLTLSRKFTLQRMIAGGMVLLALVWVRQIHLWCAGLLIARAFIEPWCHSYGQRTSEKLTSSAINISIAALACLPAVLTVLYFYGTWGGLTPPTFAYQYHSINAAGPAFVLAVVGVVGVFFIGYILPVLRSAPGWVLFTGACLGILLALLPVTTAGEPVDYFAGRRTGLWDIAAKFPMIGGRTSIIIVIFSALGALVIGAYVARWRTAQSIVLLCALTGYAAALSAGGELWQRYAEPFVLLLYVLWIAFTPMLDEPRVSDLHRVTTLKWDCRCEWLQRLAWCGPLVLSLAFAGLTLRDLRKPGTQFITDPPPPAETASVNVPAPRPDSPYSRYMIHKGLLRPKSAVPTDGS